VRPQFRVWSGHRRRQPEGLVEVTSRTWKVAGLARQNDGSIRHNLFMAFLGLNRERGQINDNPIPHRNLLSGKP